MAVTPSAAGFRWPAEWEPHAATWLSWPHNQETWPGCLPAAEAAFVAMVRALVDREGLCINVRDAVAEERVRALLTAGGVAEQRGVAFFHFPTDDAWVRDHGPVFLLRELQGRESQGRESHERESRESGPERERAVVDFDFDSWGGKYPPWDRDDAIPRRVAEALGLRRFSAGFVLEGGSVEGDGRGTLLTTESCLLNPNRHRSAPEPDRERLRARVEQRLADYLAARRVLWLGGQIVGDDTDGHVDDMARFVAPGVVVAAEQPDPAEPDHVALRENLRSLRRMRDAEDKPLSVATLPMPPAVTVGGQRCPASYVNFYLANGVALVPVFDVDSDARALAVLGELLPGRELVPIPARELVLGLGAVHCLTQQEPA